MLSIINKDLRKKGSILIFKLSYMMERKLIGKKFVLYVCYDYGGIVFFY